MFIEINWNYDRLARSPAGLPWARLNLLLLVRLKHLHATLLAQGMRRSGTRCVREPPEKPLKHSRGAVTVRLERSRLGAIDVKRRRRARCPSRPLHPSWFVSMNHLPLVHRLDSFYASRLRWLRSATILAGSELAN